MRKRLFNQQSEPRSRETQKTWRLSVKAKIMMALFALMLIPQGTWAQIEYYSYNAASGAFEKASASNYKALSGSSKAGDVTLSSGTYVCSVSSGNPITYDGRIIINGDVNIILCDGAVLEAQMGINVPDGATLTIYAQEKGTGQLNANGFGSVNRTTGDFIYCAAIGGYYDNTIASLASPPTLGTVYIHGGQITANSDGCDPAAGIGGCNSNGLSDLTIYGGKITATGGKYGAGIGGGGLSYSGCDVSIYGGEVIATGGNGDSNYQDYEAMGIGRGSYSLGSSQGLNGTLYIYDNVTCSIGTGSNLIVKVGEQTDIANRARIMSTDYQYALTVGGAQVKASNASNLFNSSPAATASFYAATNTLALNGLSITSGNPTIVSGLDDLTIDFSGANTLGNSGGFIQSTNANAVLTFKTSTGTNTLDIQNTLSTPSAIDGFSSVNLNGAYLRTDNNPFHFNSVNKVFEGLNGGLQSIQVTSTPYYMLWVGCIGTGFTQATEGLMGNYGSGTVSFTQSGNILTLTDASIEGFIESGLDNLKIHLIGANSITESGAYTSSNKNPIYSDNNGTLTFTTDGTGSLEFLDITPQPYTNPITYNFSSVTYDNDLAYNSTSSVIAINYNLWVDGTQVTSVNANTVATGVSYNSTANELTLNATYTVAVKTGLADLNVKLLGNNQFYSTSKSVFEGVNGTEKINFITDPAAPGWYEITAANGIFKNISTTNVTYQDDLRYWKANETNFANNKALIRQHLWEGQGTSNAPYHISNTTDLTNLAEYVKKGYIIDDYFDLNVPELDCSGLASFPSIGKRVGNYTIYSFDGTFDGGGNKISNLTSPYGLFAHVGGNGTIKDLTLENCTANGGTSSGGKTNGSVPSESAGGVVAEFRSSGKIENCHVVGGSVSGGSNDEVYFVGGVVGALNSGTIDLCTVENVDISELNASRTVRQSVGGIVGLGSGGTINGCSVTVNKSTSTAKISNQTNGSNVLNTGAIIGEKESGTLTNNTYNADVEVVSQYAATTVTKSGNDQRGIGGGGNDDIDYSKNTHGVELAGVNIITLAASTNGSIEAKSGYYKVEGTKVYALPYSLSSQTTVVRATSDNGYDSPSISVIKDGTTDKVNLTGSVTGVDATTNKNYSDNSFEMPNYNVTATGSFPIDFSNANRTFTISNPVGPVVYDGTAIAISEIKTTLNSTELTLSSTDFTITGYKDKTSGSTFTSAPKDAGQYEATIKPSATSVNKGTGTVDFTISQRSISNVRVDVSNTYRYTGTPIIPTLTVSDGNIPVTTNDYDISYKKNDNGTLTDVTEMKDAGDYKIVLAGKGNYNDSKSIDFSIGQADATMTPPTAKTLTYNGADQELVTAGSSSDGQIQYKLSTETAWSTSIPKGQNAGSYIVDYKLVGDGNHKDIVSDNVPVTISPKTISKNNTTITLSSSSFEYNKALQQPSVQSVAVDGKNLTTGDYSVSYNGGTDVGSYTVTVTGTGNYDGSATADFSITAAPITPVIEISDWVYGAYNATTNGPKVTDASNPGGGAVTFKYKKQGDPDANYGTSLPTLVDDYTVQATVAANGNYQGGTATANFSIKKAASTMTPPTAKTLTYNGTDQELVTAGSSSHGQIQYKLSTETAWSTSIPKGQNAGSYIVDYKLVGDGNHEDIVSDNVPVTISPKTISKNNTTITLSSSSFVYNTTVQQPSVQSLTVDGKNLTTGDYSVSYNGGTDVGSYTVTVTGTGNYDGSATADFSITAAPITPVIEVSDWVYGAYNATTNGPKVTDASNPGGGAVTFKYKKQGDPDANYGTSLPTLVDDYTVQATVAANGNYQGGTATANFSIKKAASTVTPPTAKSLIYTGSAQELITAGSATGGNIEYSLDGATYSTTIPSGTDAKTYTVYYRVTGDNNHNNVAATTVDVTIDQATLTSVEIDQTQFVYDPTKERVVNVTKVMAGTVEVPVGSYEIVSNSNKATDRGPHTVTVQGKAGSNFKGTASTTFVITERTVNIDFGGRTFRTFYDANEPFLVPDNITAYIVTGVSGNAVTTKKVSYIQAGVPVLLETTPGTTNVVDPAESYVGNKLKYAAAATPATEKHYVLYNNEFVRASGTINGKVYLDLTGYSGGARTLVIGDGTTAIEGIVSEEDDDAKWYDMQGRRINKPTKSGLYIKDGKKVVVKTRY